MKGRGPRRSLPFLFVQFYGGLVLRTLDKHNKKSYENVADDGVEDDKL